MGNITSTLTLQLVDDGLAGKAAKDAEALKRLGASGDALKKLGAVNPKIQQLTKSLTGLEAQAGKITAFKDAGQNLRGLHTNLKAARGEIERTTAALSKQSGKLDYFDKIKQSDPKRYAKWVKDGLVDTVNAKVRAARAEANAAKRALPAIEKAYGTQLGLVKQLRGELVATDAPIGKLAASQTALRGKIEATSAAIREQVAVHEKAGRQAEVQARHEAKRATASRDLAAGMGGAGRGALPGAARRDANNATSRRMLDGMGAPSISARAAREERRQEAIEARAQARAERRQAAQALAHGGAIVAGTKVKSAIKEGVAAAGDFDIAVRKQKVFQDLSDEDQVGLRKQAQKIGAETQFSNIDVVKAQTAAMQGLPTAFDASTKAKVSQGVVGNARNFATLMDTDLTDSTGIIRGYLQASGKDISTPDKANFEANKATNQLVKMAKLGGMSGDDVKQFSNYAIASATASGLSTDATMSLGALARRGGLTGDVAGTAVRSMAGKIVAPTSQGIAALNAAGIRHSDFVKMPDQLSTGALEGQFQNKIGKSFSPEIKGKLDKINADKDLIADRGRYIAAVTEAVSPILGKDKKGKVRASDSARAAKAAGDFHKVSAQSVDAEGLLDAAMTKGMTLPQLNAWLTDKHGGKGSITQRQWDEFKSSKQAIGHAADDPDYAKKKADYVYAGLGGSLENARGSVENAKLAAGESIAPVVKWGADTLGSATDQFSNLPQPVQATATITAGIGAAAATLWGTLGLTKLAMGLGGKTAAAAAAEAVAGGTAGTMTAGAGGAAAAAAGGGVAAGTILGGGALLGGYLGDAMPKAFGNGGSFGDQVGALADLQNRVKAGEAATKALGYSNPGKGVQMPGGTGTASGGFPTQYQQSRGMIGDFLNGKETRTDTLPMPSSMTNASMGSGAGGAGIDGLKAKAGEVEAKLSEISSKPVAPPVDTSALDKVAPAAAGAKTALEGLNVAVSPKVDTASIAAALAMVQQLAGALAGIGSQAAAAGAAVGRAGAAANAIKGRSGGGTSPSFSDGATAGAGAQ